MITEREQSEVGLFVPSFPSAWSLQADDVLCPRPQVVTDSVLHVGFPPSPNCSLPFSLHAEGSMPPHGAWPKSTMVLFLHLAHICVNSPFINSPQLPSLRCPLFPAETLCDI